MKRAIFGMVLALALAAPARAEYLEGVEYALLAAPQAVETGNRIEVREVFWYGCPHCYALEPVLAKWLKTLPANARFLRMPGGQWAPSFEPHARTYYALEALGLLEKLHMPLFDAIHGRRRALNDEASIGFFVVEQGVKDADFRKAYSSFGVGVKVRTARQYLERSGIRSVPTIVVDGRYTTSASMAGSHEEALKVVDFLIKKAAAERSRGKP